MSWAAVQRAPFTIAGDYPEHYRAFSRLTTALASGAQSGHSGRVPVDEVEFWVYEVFEGSPLGTNVTGKVFSGTLRVGDVLGRVVVDNASHNVALHVEEIEMYEAMVDELDTGVSGRILVTGGGVELLEHDALLYVR